MRIVLTASISIFLFFPAPAARAELWKCPDGVYRSSNTADQRCIPVQTTTTCMQGQRIISAGHGRFADSRPECARKIAQVKKKNAFYRAPPAEQEDSAVSLDLTDGDTPAEARFNKVLAKYRENPVSPMNRMQQQMAADEMFQAFDNMMGEKNKEMFKPLFPGMFRGP